VTAILTERCLRALDIELLTAAASGVGVVMGPIWGHLGDEILGRRTTAVLWAPAASGWASYAPAGSGNLLRPSPQCFRSASPA
jgi:hypothetical protein